MGSVSRGFRLAKASWAVVKQDRELLWLPVISFFCSLAVMIVFGLGMVGIGLPQQGESPNPGIYVLGFVMYVALAFVTIYFNAAVIGTAMKRLKGEDAKISDGLARQHIGKIFLWALVTATVGMVLRTIQERSGLIGRILIGIVGIAWSVLTFFVVPVLLYEPVGVRASIKRSAAIFRQRWGLAVHRPGHDRPGVLPHLDPRHVGRPVDRRGGPDPGRAAVDRRDRCVGGRRDGVLRRVQRGALSVRDDG